MLPDTPRTFLNGEKLGLDSDGAEELRRPECACNANRHEHTAEVFLIKFHAIFLPEPLEGLLSVRPRRQDVFKVDVLLVSLKLGPTGHRNVDCLVQSQMTTLTSNVSHGTKEDMRRTLPSV